MLKRLIPLILLLPATSFAQDDGWPRTIAHEAGEIVIEKQPQRIVSISPSLTGILLAIDTPVAATASAVTGPLTDDKGFFDQWAGVADQRGVQVLYNNLNFDMESLIVQDADLVVASSVGGDTVLPYLAELQAQDVPVIVLDYSTHGWEDLARTLGTATGHESDAARVVTDFAAQAADARPRLNHPAGHISIVSYNFAGTYGISKPTSAQARVMAALGFDTIAIPDDLATEVSRSADFDFISYENLPAAIRGETVFLLNGTDETVSTFLADPMLANLPAVQSGQVYPLGLTSFRVDYYSGLQIIETVRQYLGK
ncbi:Fe2+-enterobactin ABC transporter substrate-binding protein [Paracoccus sp. DMF-8]|uniref:Fe2+-enterobactin ABC transporter substrate-binding protein n=1 Tax=Paracoccus sp. DMF-8 TaxID=3019445 RepID=UPI0023E454ED|nr:Fe2+-enterobactin ABC transporter substrate-binding protein [Paracoccus sp. DMF-8]MDF3608160.1 Fe2+-enterobactin ABC transporter substrate-binding protein [Paracoccus sp. DMF-8]